MTDTKDEVAICNALSNVSLGPPSSPLALTSSLRSAAAGPSLLVTPSQTSNLRHADRFRMLQASLPSYAHRADVELVSVVERIVADINATPETEVAHWGPLYPSIFKKPLPYDSCNPGKPGLMLELLQPVGEQPLHEEVWRSLLAGLTGQAQTGKMVLLTGTSGMGKTKAAYDIGMKHACVVMLRVCERDAATLPWEACFRFLRELLHTAPTERSAHAAQTERITVKAVLLYLIAAHLQWVVDISRKLAEKYGGAREPPPASTLREVLLRAQRNGLAYQSICHRFVSRIAQELERLGADGVSSVVALRPEDACNYLLSLATEARSHWAAFPDGENLPLVFAYDEIQALLDPKIHVLPANVCQGVYSDAGTSVNPSQGIFYGTLAAIRHIIDGNGIVAGHVLLGNSWVLDACMLERHSPAQGVYTPVQRPFNFTEADILALMEHYLTEHALTVLEADKEALHRFVGRPLFAIQLFLVLPTALKFAPPAARGSAPAIDKLLTDAVQIAYDNALAGAMVRLAALATNGAPSSYGAAVIPSVLVRKLIHHVFMYRDGNLMLLDEREELRAAVQQGVLNLGPTSTTFQPRCEHLTLKALEEWGRTQVRLRVDGIMEYLAQPLAMAPAGSEAEVQGEVMENCVAWYLVRRCMCAEAGTVSLRDLLKPLLAKDVTVQAGIGMDGLHESCLPPCLTFASEWRVSLRGGHAGGEHTFARLQEQPNYLIHHTVDGMAGPDLLFLAHHVANEAITKLVAIQVKIRETGTVRDSLRTLNPENWKDASRDQAFMNHPAWKLPVRCLFGARAYQQQLLHMVAWYNTDAVSHPSLSESPVVCLQGSTSTLGVDIFARWTVKYGKPTSEWPSCLWPPEVADIRPRKPSCKVHVSGPTKKAVKKIVERTGGELEKKLRICEEEGKLFYTIAHFKHFAAALAAVREHGCIFSEEKRVALSDEESSASSDDSGSESSSADA